MKLTAQTCTLYNAEDKDNLYSRHCSLYPCLCMCRFLGLRDDSAINIFQQTLMKRQEIETCLQTVSGPTASIRFYLESDVMVIDRGVQPSDRHSRYWFFRAIFQSNQRAVKSVLCKSLELQGPLTGIAFFGEVESWVNWYVFHSNIHMLLLMQGKGDCSLPTWQMDLQSGSVE